MAYEDVPQRLRDGEAVPRSEIVGHYGSANGLQVRLGLEVLRMAGIMFKEFSDETTKFGLTPLGLQIREDFITRLEGDCPECP